MRVADYVASRLRALGCEDVYMVTGGAAMHLNDAFGKVFSGNVHNLHHEQSCAMAAESYARLKGIPAIVNVTAGPGAINAINGVFGAYVDSIPMIVISGQAKCATLVQNSGIDNLRQLGDQEVDITYMVKKVCKRSVLIQNSTDILDELDYCYQLATTGRPGPVWIDIPIDIQATLLLQQEDSILHLESFNKIILDSLHLESNDEKIKQLAYMLLTSNRPVLYVGNGIRLSKSYEQLLDFLDEWPIATVTNWNSNDLIWDDHPSYSGRPGTVGNRAGNFAVQFSECVVILGSRMNIRQVSFNWDSFAKYAWKCHIDIDDAELHKPTMNTDLKIHTCLENFLPTLTLAMRIIINEKQLHPCQIKTHWLNWVNFNKLNLKVYCPVAEARMAEVGSVNPYRLLNEFSKLQPEGAITVLADGSACVVGFQAMKLKRKQRIFHNSGCASMGYELPASIGAYHASQKPIACIAGDGSIMMNLQELTYIGEYKLPITILLLNNKGYHSIRQTQVNYFPGNLVGCGLDSNLPFTSFKALSTAFGLEYLLVDDENSMKSTMMKALAHTRPIIVECIIDLQQEFSPKLASRKLENGQMITSELEDMSPFLDRDVFESIKQSAFQITRSK